MSSDRFDVCIIGGGPAGAQCALWLKMLGVRVAVLEVSDALGGLQKINPYLNNWIVTSPYEQTGEQTALIMQVNLVQQGVDVFLNATDQVFEQIEDGHFSISFQSGSKSVSLLCEKIVISTGVCHKKGDFAASENVIIGSGHVIDHYDFEGLDVAILGGGDSAAENYSMIKDKGAGRVKVFARTLRARDNLLSVIPSADIHEGSYRADASNMTLDGVKFDVFCVMYGWAPVDPIMPAIECAKSDAGFFAVDRVGRTSKPNIFAIGECAGQSHPCVVTAMAEGVECAKAIQGDLGI